MKSIHIILLSSVLGLSILFAGAMLLSGLLITTGKLSPNQHPMAKQALGMLSSLGNDAATHMLASIRLFQSDDPAEMKKGLAIIEKEAEEGSCYSAGKLGWAYQHGLAVTKDLQKAKTLYERSAKCGMTYWQILLSHAHEKGYLGYRQDPIQATYWREMKPKVHTADYNCWVADYYRNGTFPPDDKELYHYANLCGR